MRHRLEDDSVTNSFNDIASRETITRNAPSNTGTDLEPHNQLQISPDHQCIDSIDVDDVRVNPLSLRVLDVPKKGRGVFSREPLSVGTVIEEAPVLVFTKEAYQRMEDDDNLLKDYVFTWGKMGDMALALGMGSLFNHDKSPNVSYEILKDKKVIRYRICKSVQPGEELCIYYGNHVNFDEDPPHLAIEEAEEANFEYLDYVDSTEGDSLLDYNKLVVFEDLPCYKITQHSSSDKLRLVEFWTIEIPAPLAPEAFKAIRSCPFVLDPMYSHVKRIKPIQGNGRIVSILLQAVESISRLDIEDEISKTALTGNAISVSMVPAGPARTKDQCIEWNKFWPTVFIDRRTEKEKSVGWKRGQVEWARDMMKKVKQLTKQCQAEGEVPISCLVTESWADNVHTYPDHIPGMVATGKDSRNSTGNVLCHSFSNVIDAVAALDRGGHRSVQFNHNTPAQSQSQGISEATATPTDSGSATPEGGKVPYLLTGFTVFTSHEPCIYCSMALLHSRIDCLIYRTKSVGSGGCGTVLSVHEDGGLNHKYEAWRWREGGELESSHWDA